MFQEGTVESETFLILLIFSSLGGYMFAKIVCGCAYHTSKLGLYLHHLFTQLSTPEYKPAWPFLTTQSTLHLTPDFKVKNMTYTKFHKTAPPKGRHIRLPCETPWIFMPDVTVLSFPKMFVKIHFNHAHNILTLIVTLRILIQQIIFSNIISQRRQFQPEPKLPAEDARGYSNLNWLRRGGPKFQPPPSNGTREDTILQPIF